MFEIEMRFPKQIYSSTAILKSAYGFLDRCYIHIGDGGDAWTVQMKRKDKQMPEELLGLDFENELIAQALRERVFQQTKTIREMLMARAMTSSVIDTGDPLSRIEHERGDVSDDELNAILTSWFEQHE